jgi:pyroglutamyl-peptidase
LGVNGGAQRIHLEKQAVNCNDFSMPDVQGNQPINDAIDKGEEIDHCFKSKVDIDSICLKLKEEGVHDCCDSTDAGKFLCNYIYYTSMREFEEHDNIHVIFIHVPMFTTQDKDKQIACIYAFIKSWISSV